MLDYWRRINWQEYLHRGPWLSLVVLVVLAGYLCFISLLRPAWHRYQEALAELSKHRAEFREVSGTYQSVLAAKRLWDQLQEQAGRPFFRSRSLDERDVVILSFFYQVQQFAGETGLLLQDINQNQEATTTSAEDQSLAISEHGLTLRLWGTYDQLTAFTHLLASSQQPARLDSVVLTAGGGNDGDKLEMVLKVTLLFFG